MMQSMTGFGQSERTTQSIKIGIEIKSVNHRYMETMVRMPREYVRFEDGLKRLAAQAVKRGRLDVFVNVEKQLGAGKRVEIDWDLLQGYRDAAEQIRERYRLQGTLSVEELLRLPDALSIRDEATVDDDELEREFEACASEALERLIAMRRKEGDYLRSELLERTKTFRAMQERIASAAPEAIAATQEKLRSRILDLLNDPKAFDEHRFAMEAAILADRSDIQEELTRLSSHLNQFEQLLDADEPIGRKLDFLIQEMNREVNTIGSKSSHAEITGHVVDMKAELEKMREQVQNIQ